MNNVYFIQAEQIYPVGNAGAVVIAKDAKRAAEIGNLGLQNPSPPKKIGTSKLKEQVIFENDTNY